MFKILKTLLPIGIALFINQQQTFFKIYCNNMYNQTLKLWFKRSIDISDQFHKHVLVFSGNANLPLAQQIAQILEIKLGNIKVGRFSDGQVSIEVKQNCRGKHIYIIQSTGPPVNQNLMELLLMISTMRRASAKKITVIVPYYGYARQDRKTAPRTPISAADVARLLQTVGVDRVIVLDVHSGQITGFFGPRVPCDNLQANMVALNYILKNDAFQKQNLAIVSPDAGGVARAKSFQEKLTTLGIKNTSLAMIIKQRQGPGKIATMHLVGNVFGKNVIIIDDMIDTAGTLSQAVSQLKKMGAKKVYAFATHGLFSGKALQKIRNTDIDKIIVTNSLLPHEREHLLEDKVLRLSVAPILAEAIFRIHSKISVSGLFSIQK